MSNNQNQSVWELEAYRAWLNKYGTPSTFATKISNNPKKHLGTLLPFLGEISGKKILNLMGSNGSKALALSLLGADVTVVDFSEANRQYALEMCQSLDVNFKYIVSNVLDIDQKQFGEKYDIVFAEMGILHYFTDLEAFFNIFLESLKIDGTAIIRDFHPVSTKLISSRGSTAKVRKHKVDGDYFDSTLKFQNSALDKYQDQDQDQEQHHDTLTEEVDSQVLLRHWTLGEIITAFANVGLCITSLTEEPNLSSEVFDKGIPKTFILTGKKL